jgi:hypothetical protein
LNNDSSPDIINVKAVAPADQPGADFGGPLARPFIDLFRVFDLVLKTHSLLAALLFPRFLIGSRKEQEGPSAFYWIWSFVVGPILFLLNIAALFAVADCFVLAISPLIKSLYGYYIEHGPNRIAESLNLILTQGGLIQFAKALFVLVAWVLSISALVIVNNERLIGALLFAVEDEATQTRDESVMLIRAGQASLRSLNAKLQGEEKPDPMLTAKELVKSIGPLALLFLRKERDMLRWGMAGVNVAAKGIRFIQNLVQQK